MLHLTCAKNQRSNLLLSYDDENSFTDFHLVLKETKRDNKRNKLYHTKHENR